MNELGVSIFHAEMYTVEIAGDGRDPDDRRYQEVHRFVIQDSSGKPICSPEDLEFIESELYSRLIGNTSERQICSTRFAKLEKLLDFGVL